MHYVCTYLTQSITSLLLFFFLCLFATTQMLPLCYLTVSMLWRLQFLSSALAIQCNENTQYEWPILNPKQCCNKCPPGHYYVKRSETTCDISCKKCTGERFMDTYTLESTCNICGTCTAEHSEVESNCTITHNTVCKCKAGYRCIDKSCKKCEPVPKTIKPTLPPPTTVKIWLTSITKTTEKPRNPIRDTQWFLVIVALLCAGIALVVVTKIKPFLHWIRSNHGYFFVEKPVLPCTVDEDVSKPVQEVCGKCDNCIDICIKE
ncbi:tumor necrosis factor receptor superfamily member 6 isoform X1 [Cyprinodon tularosa]|uniref:tumor necrosis factor receptor superfamily member 6 isoform X1 n=1 Tax=Cyprinodon tularosa TaxID=77115 RepID=UPI0018E2617F|nr:tumor necrosis factor receptor superfamily member 6 isoform X1 [Cyprinodon tularosa]